MSRGLQTIELSVNSAPMTAAMAELQALLAQSPPWLRWLAVEAFENLHHSVELVCVDQEGGGTSRADQLRVVAQPAEKLLVLMSALRAGNGQAGAFVETEFHGGAYAG
jgi:hypothetical protein